MRSPHERAGELLVGSASRTVSTSRSKPSDGEKQRVAIARAIANHPQIIYADEPTANLDSAKGAETVRLLRFLAKERLLAKEEETTVVMISHDERLRKVSDRVLWLEDGQLRALEAGARPRLRDAARPRPSARHHRGGGKDDLRLLERSPAAVGIVVLGAVIYAAVRLANRDSRRQ